MATTTETALTDAEIAKIREQALTVIETEGLNRTAAAREAGIAQATFLAWLNNTYEGRNDNVASRVQIWLSSRTERRRAAAALPQAPIYVPTQTASRIHEVLQWAMIGPDIVVVAGAAGVGKTTACQQFAGVNPHVWVATMTPEMASVHRMMGAIANAVGVTERNAARITDVCGAKMSGTGGLLIVDEAQHLRAPALDTLRALHDLYGIGIALVGNESVYGRLEGGEGRRPEFAQLYSRVGMRFTRSKPYGQDVCALIQAWGVTDEAAIKLLKSIAAKPGALRGMTKCLRLASMLAKGAGEALGEKHVTAAWARLSDTGAA